jgi:hypothetical protein
VRLAGKKKGTPRPAKASPEKRRPRLSEWGS